MASNRILKSIKDKQFLNKLFVGLMCLLELIILGAIVHIIIQFIKDPDDDLYNLTALGILLLWFGILVAYYAWAVYFYNINLGLTNEDWAEIREIRKHSPEGAADAPRENPNINETLGLPTGTVRGSLALSLMVSALAMTIAALGMPSVIKENSFIVDNFDFIKTAFLMMIAFYFGNKSLELIGYKSKHIHEAGNETTETRQTMVTAVPPPPPQQDISAAKEVLRKTDVPEDDDFDYPDSVQ